MSDSLAPALARLTAAALVAASCAGQTPPSEPSRPESIEASAVESTESPVLELPTDRVGLVVEVGGPLPGHPETTVTALGLPSSDSQGRLSFTGSIAATPWEEGFIWQDGRIRWRNSDAESATLKGSAPQVASSSPGSFVYRTQVDGLEALWSHRGLLVRKDGEAPGFGPDSRVLLSRRPSMLPSGRVFWVSEIRDGKGPRGRARVLYSSATGAGSDVEVVLRSGDEVGGLALARPDGLELAYDMSQNGEHHAQVVNVIDPERGSMQAVLVDGDIRLIQRGVLDTGERWERFFRVAIDDDGNYMVAAATDRVEEDLVVLYNDRVIVREGESVADFALRPPARVLALAFDDEGHASQLWSVGGVGEEVVLFACDPSRPQQGVVLLETREGVDLDGDGVSDARIERLSDLGHGNALARRRGRHLFVAVQLERPDVEMHEAILSVPVPECPLAGEATVTPED